MSALYGLVRLDGQPVGADELDAMARPMAAWGPDGGGAWREGGAGLGQLVAHSTPEALNEGGPIAIAGGQVIVVAAGRLDNRDDLCGALGFPPAERAATPDGRLLAAAYERWGEGAVKRLLGDWALAAWHVADRRLVLARDHYGATGLYYHRHGAAFAFASSLEALFALPHVPRRLDELQLAQHLVPWPVDGSLTWYEGVKRLPPAHLLTLDEASMRVSEYWHPRDAAAVRRGSDQAYAEEFAELFEAAVRTRLRSTGAVASTLSAGLDSSAVTGFAARELHGRGEALTAFTSTPAHPEVAAAIPDTMVDEWPLASLVAAMHPNVEHVRVTAASRTPLSAIRRSHEVHDEPEWGVPNLPWLHAILEDCADRGTSVLLTGQMGNGGVSWSGGGGQALRLLTSGAPAEAFRALADRRRGPGGSWRLALRRELAAPLRRRLNAELQRRRGPFGHPDAGRLIAPAFARSIDLAERIHASGFDLSFARADAWALRMATLLPGVTPVGAFEHRAGVAHGVELRDPTRDVRLLEFCLGVPSAQFVRGASDRWLMRRGIEGVVPGDVRWNTRRGLQGADLAFRLRGDGAAVSAELERLVASPIVGSYLDMAAIRGAWDEVRGNSGAAAIMPAARVAHGLNVGLFVLGFASGGTAPVPLAQSSA